VKGGELKSNGTRDAVKKQYAEGNTSSKDGQMDMDMEMQTQLIFEELKDVSR